MTCCPWCYAAKGERLPDAAAARLCDGHTLRALRDAGVRVDAPQVRAVSVDTAAGLLEMSATWVRREVKAGRVRAFFCGSELRIPVSELEGMQRAG